MVEPVRNPRNYEEMVAKYLERENEGLERVKKQRGAQSNDELIQKTKDILRELDYRKPHEPVSPDVLRTSSSEAVNKLENVIRQDADKIDEFVGNFLKQHPSVAAKIISLEGRVSKKGPVESR